MGNRLSCSCAPLMRKSYRCEDSPWQTSRRKDGHLLRLWAEVFHVSSGTGTIKWQQVSEDLVPVNITCIQDNPDCIFHITAYNSQVDKILDVKLVQPGTRIGQASECFIYWKDSTTNDTWGLNFTSPIDAKQFKECCSPAFKFSRKASSSYSLKLDPPSKQKTKSKRKPQSTPASPSRTREPQCTCMTAEQYARLRAQDPRYRSSTLPRAQTRATETDGVKVTAATSSSSLYDNVSSGKSQTMRSTGSGENVRSTRDRGIQLTSDLSPLALSSSRPPSQNHVGSQVIEIQILDDMEDQTMERCRSEGTQAGGTLSQFQAQAMHRPQSSRVRDHHHVLTSTRSMDYDMELVREPHHHCRENNVLMSALLGNNHSNTVMGRRSKSLSKSTDDMREGQRDLNLDSNTLKRMLMPMTSNESPTTSPEMTRRPKASGYSNGHQSLHQQYREEYESSHDLMSDEDDTPCEHHRLFSHSGHERSFSGSRSSHEIGRGYSSRAKALYLELGRNEAPLPQLSPPSDNVMFDNHCYATTPSSSNGNSDLEQAASNYRSHQTPSSPVSPTSRLLQEYEMHLRNTLAKGMDAESYSLHTFEALLSQSMENLDLSDRAEGSESVSSSAPRSPYTPRRRSGSNASIRSSTLPSSHHSSFDRPPSRTSSRPSSRASRDREGYYSDRNELIRERDLERERERERGYLSDHNGSSRHNSCFADTSRSPWFRLSDGWESGSAAFGSGSVPGNLGQGSVLSQRRSAWESLPSLRHDNSKEDNGLKTVRAASFEQRVNHLERQDTLRSDFLADRESASGIVHQASVESADSRLCYLTSSEMSDEDRMSLTTAISDEEDGDGSLHNSPYKGKQTGAAAASFNCTGAVRKAGFLSVKKWLLRKKHQIELARKRGWKGYWVCLKGTTLLFYPCDSREGRTVEAAPKHLIIVDGAIMQPIPEHPKRDYIFCLSTAFGDAYLFQAPCQVELENWVNSIHCACAAAFARHRGKTGTLHLLQEEIFRLDKAIEADHKLKHVADLQQSIASDQEARQQVHAQILQWEENMERLHCEQFRLRCYMASLHNGELPNPKSLLTHVSRVTKNTLNKLGVFTVSSFHAYICARSPSLLNNLLAGRGATKRRAPLLLRSNSSGSRRGMQSREDQELTVRVVVPDNQTTHISLRDAMSVEEFLAYVCHKKNLNPMEHFLRIKKREDMEDQHYFVPFRTDMMTPYLQTHEFFEVCAKILYQVELRRSDLDQMWGFSVEAELIENNEKQDELYCYVSRVEDKSYAMQKGIIKGDEIMVINGAIVSDLDMMYIESVLQEEHALCMMMRSSRTEPPEQADDPDEGPGMMRSTEAMIQSLVCPPPPSDPPTMSEEMITGLIVPAPGWGKGTYSPEEEGAAAAQSSDGAKGASRTNSFEIENLLKTAEQVTGICRSPQETRRSSPTESVTSQQSQALQQPTRPLTHAEKLRKVILELLDTERIYIEHLNNLLENYLEPLKKEFISNEEIDDLFDSIQEIVGLHGSFLQNLREGLETEAGFYEFSHPSQFKNILFAIASVFLCYVNHFKLYSSFCANHSKAQKFLHPSEDNLALQEFLLSRNPKQQHSSTLESYLIKPVQRILKYPLLLQQMRNLTEVDTTEHQHLVEALRCMEKVAEHINEMQRIHEEYGSIFSHLFKQYKKAYKQIDRKVDLNPVDLIYYGGVEWLNISDFLGKIKKGLELHAMCFVFKSAVVFLCKERLRHKKKIIGGSSKNNGDVEVIRYQVLIPVTEVQVRVSTSKDGDTHYLWELVHLRSQFHRRPERTYLLCNSTGDFRNAFLKTIRQIIRESVRNMSIPTTRNGQSTMSGNLSIPRPPPRDFSISSKGSTSSEDQESTQRSYPQPQPPAQPQQEQQPRQHQRSQSHPRYSSQTLKPRKPKPPQRHPATAVEHDTTDGEEGTVTTIRSRNKTVSDTTEEFQTDKAKPEHDPGTKSEGEEDSQSGATGGKKTLGKTPNHLTLSTTSTLSAGSTGSQAKLIQSSQQPQNYQPSQVKDLGSPVWKPRETANFGEATTLPRHKGKSGSSSAEANTDRHSTPQGHGTTTRPGRSRKSIADVMMHEK